LEARIVRFADVFALSLGALARQKVRTLLTTLGVVGGSFVLVFSLSIRQGVQETIEREGRRFGDLRMMEVHPAPPAVDDDAPPVEGAMSDDRRERIQAQLKQNRPYERRPGAGTALTRDRLRELEGIAHVRSVVLSGVSYGRAVFGTKAEYTAVGAATLDDDHFRDRVVAGDYFSAADADEALVSEFLLYRLGVRDDADLQGVVGKKLRLEFRYGGKEPDLLLALLNPGGRVDDTAEEAVLAKAVDLLPDALGKLGLSDEEVKTLGKLLKRKPPQSPGRAPPIPPEVVTAEYTVRGVLRVGPEEGARGPWYGRRQQIEVLLPSATAEELVGRSPLTREFGFDGALVEVDDIDHVKEVSGRVKAMGLQANALLDHIEREQFTYQLIFSTMALVALVALVVAALGIINTMLMGVLERTREIGVMKAVGAREGQIQFMFVVEGAVVGLAGGLLGLLLAWAASHPMDAWMRALLAEHTTIRLKEAVFTFPWWLTLGGPAFACVITTLAALYPAWRASRVNPVTALRHE
jgi:putative ABC transport system permease protein